MPVPTLSSPPVPGLDIVDLVAAEEAEAGAVATLGSTGAEVVLGPEAAIAYGGYLVEERLRHWKPWNDYWVDAGKKVADVWSKAVEGIFGVPNDTVTHEELRLETNLAIHIANRFTRQLHTREVAQRGAGDRVIANALAALARRVYGDEQRTTAAIRAVIGLEQTDKAAIIRYVQALTAQLHATIDTEIAHTVSGLKTWTIAHIYNPLNKRIDILQTQVDGIQKRANTDSGRIHHAGLQADKAILIATAAAAAAAKANKWVDDCGEPMCETVGPKSDWGQLLKRFGPKLIWLLLAEIAATHPQELEQATVELTTALGPVLEDWASSYLGFGHGSQSGAVSAVDSRIGTSDLTNLF